jgi:hypothetical protein
MGDLLFAKTLSRHVKLEDGLAGRVVAVHPFVAATAFVGLKTGVLSGQQVSAELMEVRGMF